MKVVIQNGVRHGLTRKDVEGMILFFPSAWVRAADSIVLYQTSEDRVFASYHPKEKILGLYWPRFPAATLSKLSAIEELLVAMAAIADMGHLPENLSGSLRVQYLDTAGDIRQRCLQVVNAYTGAAGDAR